MVGSTPAFVCIFVVVLSFLTRPAAAQDEPTVDTPPGEVATAETAVDAVSEPPWTDRLVFGGLLNLWATTSAWGRVPDAVASTTPFGIRTARLSLRADLGRNVEAYIQLGLEAPTLPVLDLTLSWRAPFPLQVTAGQFRIPVGATTITPYGDLVFWDRPYFVGQFLKRALRDVGVKLHAPSDFPIRYQFAVLGGAGILGAGAGRDDVEPGDLLYTARLTVDLAHWIDAFDRLELGASYATSHDTAVDDNGDFSSSTALASGFGPAQARRTHVAEADLSVLVAGAWLQVEHWFAHLTPDGAAAVTDRARGTSVELAYQIDLPMEFWLQPALRASHLRLEPGAPGMPTTREVLLTAGLNFGTPPDVRVGLYYAHHRAPSRRDHQIRVRVQASF